MMKPHNHFDGDQLDFRSTGEEVFKTYFIVKDVVYKVKASF